MRSLTRVFVYEHLSGGGVSGGEDASVELLDLGRSMRDAVVRDFAALGSIAVSRAVTPSDRPAADGNKLSDVCRRAGESAVEFVSGHARLHDVVCVIAPESQGILAALREAVDDSRWLGCDARAIAIASSKRATIRQLQTHGIPTPIPWRDGEPKRSSNAGWVIKPDDGAGAIATHWYASFDAARVELSRRAQCGLAATMEEWVTGEPLSIAMLCRPNGLDVLSLNRQHIVVDAKGSVHYRGVSLAAIEPASERGQRLVTLARHVAIALPGLHGFVGIDVVDHPEKGPVVIEVNPRITCAYVGLSAAIGRNVAAALIEAHEARQRRHAAT